MRTISLQSNPAIDTFSFRSILSLLLQWTGAFLAVMLSMILANILLPFPRFILEQMPEAGLMSGTAAMLFNGVVNAALLVWAARRSSLKGFALAGGLFVFSYLAQTFQTQIETAYFLPAFPLLHGSFEVYRLFLRGAISSATFVLLVTWLVGGFSRQLPESKKFTVQAEQFLKTSAWLGVMCVVLYLLFGYYLAWQSQELRVFYGGPADWIVPPG